MCPHEEYNGIKKTRQREILLFLSRTGSAKFGQIWDHLGRSIGERTLRDDLLHLKRLGLVTSAGRGRGALWNLVSGSAGQ